MNERLNRLAWWLPLLTAVLGLLLAALSGCAAHTSPGVTGCATTATATVAYSKVRANPVANSFAVLVTTSDSADHEVTWRVFPLSTQIGGTTHTTRGFGRTDDLAVSKWGAQAKYAVVVSIDGCTVQTF